MDSVVLQRLNEALLVPYELVAAADTAMYQAKRDGGPRCVLYREDLRGRRDRRPPGAYSMQEGRRRCRPQDPQAR